MQRRSDGIVQLRPKPAWRATVESVPAAILGMLLACTAFLAVLVAALLRFPMLVLLVLGGGSLGVAACRYGLTEPAEDPVDASPRPPRNAA